MPWLDRACPSRDELIRLAAGDLPTGRAAQVRVHVRGCAICSSASQAWQDSIDDARAASPIEEPRWQRFAAGLQAEEATWHRRQTTVRRWRSSMVAVAATVLLALAWYTQTEVTLDAEEVVNRAAAHDGVREARAAVVQRVSSLMIPTSGAAADSQGRRRGSGGAEGAEDDLRLRLHAYGFQPERALSVVPFQRWRRSIAVIDERVAHVGTDRVSVVTSATTGDIREAEIVVRTGTFEPVSQRWQFADGVAFALAIGPDTRMPLPSRAAEPASTPAVAKSGVQGTPDFEGLELDLRTTLRQLGVPVGRELQVSRVGSTVRADGTVANEATATRIKEHLRRPNLAGDVRLTAPSADRPTPSPDMEQWLNRAFVGPELRRTFVVRLWSLSSALDGEARGLVGLAMRYDARVSDTLPPERQLRLHALIDAQYRAVVERYSDLEQHLAGLVGTVSRPVFSERAPRDWRQQAPAIVADVEQLAAALRGVVTGQGTEDFAPAAAAAVRPALESLAGHLAPTR